MMDDWTDRENFRCRPGLNCPDPEVKVLTAHEVCLIVTAEVTEQLSVDDVEASGNDVNPDRDIQGSIGITLFRVQQT